MHQRLKLEFTQSNLKLFGSVAILMVLICASIYLYTQWDLRRFADSIENRSQASSPSVREESGTTQTLTEEEPPTETVALKPGGSKRETSGAEAPEIKTPAPASTKSQVDPSISATSEAMPLEEEKWDPLSEDIDWERATQDDAYLREIDNQIGHASVIDIIQANKSADPADTAFVVNMLKRSAEGIASIDDLIHMTEVWIRIQSSPGDKATAKNHGTLLALHKQLRSAKEQYARGEILDTRIYIGAPE